ncbi:DUF2062 domain-containing protein [Aequorivita echinoideorum]|uniref:DUF2062 domain-containing protein n=1 Tax=Aequorivita echinoideorum TaxID=1549647 RepID=A0ABS5S5P6_9FLAO|nr:DUF2062 domain-containing protein [Aequorivita echinoideorum]MBT0607740.1 DUF2062 domain-containing protein [Aequorivita echinoideorum]
MEQISFPKKLKNLKCCVIVPTYNNDKTLQRVLDGVLRFSKDIIVVNDGSTDTTAHILQKYQQIQQIHFSENKGKGKALREAFKHAENLGFDYALTIDSDGQHFPEDIPQFITALQKQENPATLLIGSRNMEQAGIPKKSSFGNKFSNFWFWVETGIWLQDTQSGFRLYPLFAMKELKFYTNKFEFEIEAIVKAAWSGIEVKNVPIQIHYELEDRVSHFRPFKDFTRISILNTYFVALTFLYVKPLNFIKKFRQKGFKKFLREDLLGSEDPPIKKALSVALGIFVGFSPFWGFHNLIVVFLAMVFRLNKIISFAFSNISLGPMVPFVILVSLQIGNFILGTEMSTPFTGIQNFELLKNLKAYIIGSICLSIIGATLFGFLGYIFFSYTARKKIGSNG